MRKKIVVITGGAGFVGSHLIEQLSKNKNLKIYSLDNYSSGSKKNHIKSRNVSYLKGDIKNIKKKLFLIKKKIDCIFHFGEFSRIYQSFAKFESCFETNLVGTKEVFKFCLDNNIKIIYSATSASLGNSGSDKNLSPYAFTKSKNLELLENLKKWFNFRFEIIYFYNVYGNRQISTGEMATVIGIFENQYKKNKPLTVVKPGTQQRRFTHIDDTISVCIEAWRKNKCRHYSISSRKSFTINEVAKMFTKNVKYLPKRPGERYASALIRFSNNNKIFRRYGKKDLKKYIQDFKKKVK